MQGTMRGFIRGVTVAITLRHIGRVAIVTAVRTDIGRTSKWRKLVGIGAVFSLVAACGKHEGAGTVTGRELPAEIVAARQSDDSGAAAAVALIGTTKPPQKQILFGDLHVHSTFSADAFLMSLPFMQGQGPHPISDACDYARYCSSLDFWSINDHAEALTPRRWHETRNAIRECNAVAGDPANPDTVAFLGWEWTQLGRTPDTHYGHKNVIFRDTADNAVPRRAIHSASYAARAMRSTIPLLDRLAIPIFDWKNRRRYFNSNVYMKETRAVPACAATVNTQELPHDCVEGAPTPEDLFRKLDEWGFESMVIPHGTTWGIYTPRGSTWDKQLTDRQHDADKQRLIEVFSGHGNSEEYRPWRAVEFAEDGSMICPKPAHGYEACCWRAGEIIRSRCDNPTSDLCEQRVIEARTNYLEAGPRAGRLTVPGAKLAEWRNCESCPDCYLPSMNYRPGNSVQYILALSNFEEQERGRQSPTAKRFHFGVIGSSDTHRARPGTGYKEFGRALNTDASGAKDRSWFERLDATETREATPESFRFDPENNEFLPIHIMDFERQASFFMTGGYVAVHSEGRSREQIWKALKSREVYGTSGDRILLWFDLINDGNETVMGGKATLGEAPTFRVRAVGSREQLPGCPDFATTGLNPERLEDLCRGECYNPGNERRKITRVEVVRVRPQSYPGEQIGPLIDDPWKILECPKHDAGCVVEFSDDSFTGLARDATYYVRAIQEPTPAINAAALRCSYDAEGNCVSVDPCYGDYRTPINDDCLALNEERAWSSPIYVSYDRARAAAEQPAALVPKIPIAKP